MIILLSPLLSSSSFFPLSSGTLALQSLEKSRGRVRLPFEPLLQVLVALLPRSHAGTGFWLDLLSGVLGLLPGNKEHPLKTTAATGFWSWTKNRSSLALGTSGHLLCRLVIVGLWLTPTGNNRHLLEPPVLTGF